MTSSVAVPRSTRVVLGSVIVMDDDPRTVKYVREVIVDEFGGKIISADSADDVVRLAHEHESRYFVLDIDMGEGRPTEGLKALEQVKKWWSEVFVAILSNHAGMRNPAIRMGCDYFKEKSSSRMDDAHSVTIAMLRHAEEAARSALRRTTTPAAPNSERHATEDPSTWRDDLETFLTLSEKPEFRQRIVAIVEGKVVQVGDSEEEVRSQVASKYPGKDRLVARVGEALPEINIGRPFDLLEIDFQGGLPVKQEELEGADDE
jgi:DNA-binding NarL/FixJ family response regulator